MVVSAQLDWLEIPLKARKETREYAFLGACGRHQGTNIEWRTYLIDDNTVSVYRVDAAHRCCEGRPDRESLAFFVLVTRVSDGSGLTRLESA
jgi:hypothetical protein